MDAAQLQAALLSFEDDSDAAGERYDPASGARFNALHAHEELVRLLPLGVRAVAFMLHERCRMLARTGFSDLDRELWTAQGREEVLRCGLHFWRRVDGAQMRLLALPLLAVAASGVPVCSVAVALGTAFTRSDLK